MMKKAILCVDDEALIVLSLKQELSNYFGERFLYESALNADEAMSIIDELVAEGILVILIITDWLMPGLKGDEFLIKVRERHPEIKSIMITGQADDTAIERAKSLAGVSAVLRKHWSRDGLIGAIKSCVPEEML
jgi:DNA-binding NarL/FixJ family response regulator